MAAMIVGKRLKRPREEECGDDDCSIIDVTPEKTPRRSPDSGHDEGQFSVSDVDSFDTDDVGSPAGLVIVEDQYEEGDENPRMAEDGVARTRTDDERGNSQCTKRRFLSRHAMSSSSTVGGECVEMPLCVDEQEEAGSSASVAVGDEQFIGVDLSPAARVIDVVNNVSRPAETALAGVHDAAVSTPSTSSGGQMSGTIAMAAKDPRESQQVDRKPAIVLLDELVKNVDGTSLFESCAKINHQVGLVNSLVCTSWGPLDLESGVALMMRFALDEKLTSNPAPSFRREIAFGNAPLPLVCRCCIMFGFKLVENPSIWTEGSWDAVARLTIGSEEAAFWIFRILGICAFLYPRPCPTFIPQGIHSLYAAVTLKVERFLKSEMAPSAFGRLEEWKALLRGAPTGSKPSSSMLLMKEAIEKLRTVFRAECTAGDPRLEPWKQVLGSVGIQIPESASNIETGKLIAFLEAAHTKITSKRLSSRRSECSPPGGKKSRLETSDARMTRPEGPPDGLPVAAAVSQSITDGSKTPTGLPRDPVIVAIEVSKSISPAVLRSQQLPKQQGDPSSPTANAHQAEEQHRAEDPPKQEEEKPPSISFPMHPFWQPKQSEPDVNVLPDVCPAVVSTSALQWPAPWTPKMASPSSSRQRKPPSPKRPSARRPPKGSPPDEGQQEENKKSQAKQGEHPLLFQRQTAVDAQLPPAAPAASAVGPPFFPLPGFQAYNAWLHGQRPPAMDMVVPPRPFQPGLAYPPNLVFRPPDAMSKHMYAVMSPEGLQQSLQAARMKSEATLNELNAQVRAQVMAVCRENSLLLEQQQQLLQSQQPTPFMHHHQHQQQHRGIQNHHQQRSSSEHLMSWMFPAAAGFDANMAMRSLQHHLPEHQSTLPATRLPKGEPMPSVTTHHTGFSNTNPWFGTVAPGNSWHRPTMAPWPYNGAPMPALPQQQAQPPLPEYHQRYCCANSCVEPARFACQCPGAVYCSLDCQQSDWDARHSKTCTFKQN